MQYSSQHKVCLYENSQYQWAQALTDCVLLPNGKFAVSCTLHNMQIMAALGYEAISPIMHEYDWPIQPGRKPLEHQKHMASFHTLFPRCFNLSDMGTMKTLSVLWAWDYLMLKGEVKQVMIACTMSCMVDVWMNEIMVNFLGRRKGVVVHGSREQRVKALSTSADFYIINHDGLDIGSKHETIGGHERFTPGPLAIYLRANPNINGVTIDEGAEFRHQKTDMYKSLKHGLRDKPYFNWLTGTPTPKEPTDAYAQAKMVRLDFNESWTSFRERTMYKIGTFKWKAKQDGYDIAASILKPAIRYDREGAGLKLPPCVPLNRKAELAPSQVKAIKELKDSLKTMIGEGQINAINEASLRTKLLQIACGAVYGTEKKVFKVDCAPRIKVLRELIEQSTHKLIVFAPFTSVINMLYSELSKDFTVERVAGDVSNSARNDIFRNFRECESPRIIVAHPRTMAHGLSLTAASTTIWYAPCDDAGVFEQANKRFDRPGQQNSMFLGRIYATAIEREIFRRLDEKISMQGLMLDLIKGNDI